MRASGRTRMAVSALALMAAASSSAEPAQPVPTWTREVRDTLGTAVNPLGLQDTLEVSWLRPLSASDAVLVKDAHLSFGVTPRLTPAYARLGAWIEIAPLSVLELRAGIEPGAYFGTFKSLLYFDGYAARFDNDARKARGDEARGAAAGRIYLAPTLKAKAGRVVVRAHAEFEWWKASERGTFFYEPERDTLLRAASDSMVRGDALILYELGGPAAGKRYLGAAYDLTWVYAASENRRQTLGIAGVCGLGAKRLGVSEPALFVKVFSYLEDPSKAGQLGAQLAVTFRLGRSSARRASPARALRTGGRGPR